MAVNAIAFVTFWYDKKIAGTGKTRVPELVLVALAFGGGWMLGYVAMRLFHHKTGANSQDFRNKIWGRLGGGRDDGPCGVGDQARRAEVVGELLNISLITYPKTIIAKTDR